MLRFHLLLRYNAAVVVPRFLTLHIQILLFLLVEGTPPCQKLEGKVSFCLLGGHGKFFALTTP